MRIPQVCGGKVRRSNIICGRDPTRWILHQHDRYSSLSSQGGNQPAGGCLGCRYCCQRFPFHRDTPCFPTNRTLLERASHYACHHLAGQGCGGCASACPPHYHPTQMIFDTSQFSHVSLSLSLSLYKWVLKTLVLYSQDPSSSYGTVDKGQRECLSDCLCASCGFVIKSSNCNHAFP